MYLQSCIVYNENTFFLGIVRHVATCKYAVAYTHVVTYI